MPPRRHLVRAVLIACAAALACAPAAGADIFAAVEVPGSDGNNSDIAIVNAATGGRSTLPSSVNSADNELHPSITPDGKRLVFQRLASGGVDRIVVADLTSSTTADLFGVLDAQQFNPLTPIISPDGSTVTTGGLTSTLTLTTTPLSSFPGGPFTHSTSVFAPNDSGQLMDPVQRGSITAAGLRLAGRGISTLTNEILLHSSTKDLAFPANSSQYNAEPALDATDGIVVYTHATNALDPSTLRYRSSDPNVSTASDTAFPGVINAGGAYEIHPAFTPDDHYLGFVRFSGGGDEFLYVFDMQSQTMLNPSGIDLGAMKVFSLGFGFTDMAQGSISLRQQPVFKISAISTTGLLSGKLNFASGVGILVQKITGHHQLLGRTVPTLQMVGRVPLGNHRRGAFKIKWDHRVGGKPLKPGRYLVTIRAVTGTTVHDFGNSFTIRIR